MSSPSPSSLGETELPESSIPRTTCIYISHDHVDIANPIHHDDSMINRWSEGSETRITTNCALLGCYPLRERRHCRHPFVAGPSWLKSLVMGKLKGIHIAIATLMLIHLYYHIYMVCKYYTPIIPYKRSIIWKLPLRMTIESNPSARYLEDHPRTRKCT